MANIDFSFLDEAFENIPIKELFDFVRSYKLEANIIEAENYMFEEFLLKNDPISMLDLNLQTSSSIKKIKSSDFVDKFVQEKIEVTEDEASLDEETISKNELADEVENDDSVQINDELEASVDQDIHSQEDLITEIDNSIKNFDQIEYDEGSDEDYEIEKTVKVTTITSPSEKNINSKSRLSSRFLHPKMSHLIRSSLFANNLMDLEHKKFSKNYLEDLSENQVHDFKAKIRNMRIEHIKQMNHFEVELFEIELSIKELQNAKLGMELNVDSEKSFFTFLKNLNQKCSNLLEKYRLGISMHKADLKEIQKRVKRKEEMSGVLMPVDNVLLEIEVQKSEVLEKEKISSCYGHRFDEYDSKKKVLHKMNEIRKTKASINQRLMDIKEQQKVIDNLKIENEKTQLKVEGLQKQLNINSYKLSKFSAPTAFQYILLSDILRETEINLEKEKRLNRILKMKITNAKNKCHRMKKY